MRTVLILGLFALTATIASPQSLLDLQSADPSVRMTAFYGIVAGGGIPSGDATKVALINLLTLEETYITTLTSEDDNYATYFGNVVLTVASLRDLRSLNALVALIHTGSIVTDAIASFGPAAIDAVAARIGDPDPRVTTGSSIVLKMMLSQDNQSKVNDPVSLGKIAAALQRSASVGDAIDQAIATQAQLALQTVTPAFNDVPPSAAYFVAANLMYEAGVTVGCVGGSTPQTRSYCPNDNVTREQMAAFIVRAVTGEITPTLYNPTPQFADVPSTNPFFPHIQKLMELGITVGCQAGPPALYCPGNPVPRWQMAIFMVRARLGLYGALFSTASTPYFADVPTNVEGNGQLFPFIQRAYEEHITVGCGTNPLTYCPDQLVTRGQMASFIRRALFNETTSLGPTDPLLAGVTPNTMAAAVGTQITVTITGVNTNFQSGDWVTVPSARLDVTNVVVNSTTSISATLMTNGATVPGPQTLVVVSGGQTLTLPMAIHVGTY